MKVGESKPAFLAIAMSPQASTSGVLEFLIKDLPEGTAHDIVGLSVGDKVLASEVMGNGFPVARVPPTDFDSMLIFATGSGIAPIKALIEEGSLEANARKDVRLYYGAHDNDSMAYKDLIPAWETKGITVVRVLSARGEGYVQDVYARSEAPADPARTCVLLCGQKEMAEAVRSAVSSQGVSLDNCLTNF